MSKQAFQSTYSLEARSAFSKQIIAKYLNKVPCYIYVHRSQQQVVAIHTNKFVVGISFTIGELIFLLRKNIASSQSILLFSDDACLLHTSSTIGELYAKYCDQDGILYMSLITENTFG